MAMSNMTVARLPPLSGGKIVSLSSNRSPPLEALTGPSYRVNGRTHPLPPPNALKPYMDTKSGELDTWPGHASSPCRSLALAHEEEGGKADMIPKPRFLKQLENFLRKELRALEVTELKPSELRLQAYREVFEYLIEDFRTYKPLLSAIKQEYEMMLAHQRQQIGMLEPLQQILVTVSEQCELKILALRDEEREEMTALKKENRNLYGKISELKNKQDDLREQVERLKVKLEEEYHRYRDECDARKILVADINDLRYQQEDYLASRAAAEMNQDTEEDPIVLKIALQKSREAETAATQRLNEMVANYGDVVPRRDFEMLQTKFTELQKKLEISHQDFRKLQTEHNMLLEIQKQVTQKRDDFYIELETLKRSSTPRPAWDKCADFVQGGMVRWRELSQGKRSNELVDVLLSEIQSGGFVDSGAADYFDPQGTELNVPPYLRWDKPVRNRRLSKRDAALLIRDIWRTKAVKDAERTDGKRQKMSEFVAEYLKSSFPLEQMVIEWGYNLHDACQRFGNDNGIGFFWKVLNEEADEEIHHSQLVTIHTLLTHMSKIDAEKGTEGMLGLEDFQRCLSEFFQLPDKDDGEWVQSALVRSAMEELELKEEQFLDYRSLFTEDDEGKTGPFLSEIKNFLKNQRQQYIQDIQENLQGSNQVSVDALMRAISMADPEIRSEKMHEYLAWTFNTTIDRLQEVDSLDLTTVLDRLSNGNISRVGRKM